MSITITAYIRRGKRKGQTAEVSQWCNDWFMLDDDPKPYSPTSLAFTYDAMEYIRGHKNNGTLFQEFQADWALMNPAPYLYGFKRRKR